MQHDIIKLSSLECFDCNIIIIITLNQEKKKRVFLIFFLRLSPAENHVIKKIYFYLFPYVNYANYA